MSKQPPNRPRTSIAIIALIFAVIVIVLLGAASALFGLGSAPFIGKWSNFDSKTTSVGLVLVVEGLIFLYKLVKHLPQGSGIRKRRQASLQKPKRTVPTSYLDAQ